MENSVMFKPITFDKEGKIINGHHRYMVLQQLIKSNPYEGLNRAVKEINSTFKIKVNGINFTGQKMNTLLGVSGLINLIGVELCNILFERAFNCIGDKCVCKLRRGLKVTFYLY
jgi:hypothetical protein